MWTACYASPDKITFTYQKNGNSFYLDCLRGEKGTEKEVESGSDVYVICPDYDLICDDKWGYCVYGYELSNDDNVHNCACRPGNNLFFLLPRPSLLLSFLRWHIGWKGTQCTAKDNIGEETLTLYSGVPPSESNPSHNKICVKGSTISPTRLGNNQFSFTSTASDTGYNLYSENG